MLEAQDVSDKHFWEPEDILRLIPQEDIFRHYLGVDPNTVNGKFCSPLRRDKNPTCSYKWFRGKLWFRDWSEPRAKDCFNIVQEIYMVDYGEAIQIIAEDFGLSKDSLSRDTSFEPIHTQSSNTESSEKKRIHVKTKSFTKQDRDYLDSYHIPLPIARYYNVHSVQYMWVDGTMKYIHTPENPALGYYFGTDSDGNQRWKLYFYKKKIGIRFLGNTNRINGWIQIPDTGQKLVITKSMKDVLCFARYKVPAIAMQSEHQVPYDYIIEELEERYDDIITFFDFDRTGIKTTNVLKKEYNLPYVFLTNGRFGTKDYGAKDFSDYIREFGVEAGEQLLDEFNLL